MTNNGSGAILDSLDLRSELSELPRVHAWVESIAARYGVPMKVQFAMKLCLEEALSNTIRHGYSAQPDRPIRVEMRSPEDGQFVFTIDDEAKPFNPADAPDLPALRLDSADIGGQGIRLLRKFADTLEYEATPVGNRLSIGFFLKEPPVAGKF